MNEVDIDLNIDEEMVLESRLLTIWEEPTFFWEILLFLVTQSITISSKQFKHWTMERVGDGENVDDLAYDDKWELKCKDEEKYDDDDEMTCPGQDTGPLVNETDEVRNRWTMIGPVNLFYTILYFQKGELLRQGDNKWI